MTRKEAIDCNKNLKMYMRLSDKNQPCKFLEENYIALDMAIKALEQETCEDAINRKIVIAFISGLISDDKEREKALKFLNDLSSVNPQPKTGHWIEGQSNNPNIHNILCSRCIEGYPSKGHANSQYTREKFQWCPKCGARMVEPQESED